VVSFRCQPAATRRVTGWCGWRRAVIGPVAARARWQAGAPCGRDRGDRAGMGMVVLHR